MSVDGAVPVPPAHWLQALHAATDQPPRVAREPLALAHPVHHPDHHSAHPVPGGALWRIGTLEPALAHALAGDGLLQAADIAGQRQWLLLDAAGQVVTAQAQPAPMDGVSPIPRDAVSAALERVALRLRERGWTGAWRDELLEVTDHASAQPLGRIERGAVRPLGIRTRAVHLVGSRPDGAVWVQQRAWTKANDPGRWDTLMGGMIGARDTLDGALARETWEEAGLRIEALGALRHGGHVLLRQPCLAEAGAMGYMEERIDWFHAVVPAGLEPVNQDGEVERFEALAPQALLRRLLAGDFTAEAARVLAAWQGWSI